MARVPLQSTPTEQLRVGSAPQLSATEVRPMDDVVTDDIQRSSKAFNQFAQIAKGLQDERDDAHSKELHTEYQTRALEIENDYLSTELGNAVKVVGYEDDGTTPITAYDQKVKDLNALKEEIAERSENKNQLAIFNEKSSATILSSTNRMSKHSIAEGSKHANNEALADIDNSVTATGLSVDDFNMGENSEYVKNLIALDVKIKNYMESKGISFVGDSQGSTEDSETYINLRNGYLNKVHDASIGKLLINGEYRKAAEYLEFHKGNGTIAEGEVNKHMKTIQTGLNKENGENIANNIIDGKNINSNDGGFTSSAQVITSLEGSNNATNSNGMPYVEGNGKEINIINLEKLQKQSKYYKEGATVSLPPEHRTTHLFLTKEFGVQKADSLFTVSKKLLKEEGFVIDKEKMKTDSAYAAEVNSKLMEKVVNLSQREIAKKYGEGNESELYTKDLNTVVSKIDYTYKDTQQPSMRVGEDGVFNLEDALVFARENIKDKNVLEYVEANLKDKHSELTDFAEENYKDKILGPAEKLAYAKPGGWKDIKPEVWEQLKNDDKENLQKGFSKTDDRNTIIAIERGEINITDENADNYQSLESLRYLMTESTYQDYALGVSQSKSGSGSGSGSSSVDTAMFEKNLSLYKYETNVDLLKNKDKPGDDYLDLKYALKKDIAQFEIDNGRKPSFNEKEGLLQEILQDRVFVAGNIRGRTLMPIDAVDPNKQKKVFVLVGGKKIYMSNIPEKQEEFIIKSILKSGKPVTQQRIAEYWVESGMPKTDSLVETTQGIGEIKGPTYGMMAG
jgi:hypothetical protein